MTETALSLVDSLGTALLSISMTGERQSKYSSETIIIRLARQTPSKLGGSKLRGSINEGRVAFPSTKVLLGSQETNLSSVDTQVTF